MEGPNTILDGSGGKLTIGDFCSMSSGVQIYTHNSVKWALTGGKSDYETGDVKIGDQSYIGPNSLISMNSKIGKCSIIGEQIVMLIQKFQQIPLCLELLQKL